MHPKATLPLHALPPVPVMMQMNTVKHMNPAKAALIFGAIGAPAAVSAHPNLRALRDHALHKTKALEGCLGERGNPLSNFFALDSGAVDRTELVSVYREGVRLLHQIRDGSWDPFLRSLRKHFPPLAKRLKAALDRNVDSLTNDLVFLGHMLGEEPLLGADEDLAIPFPEDVGDGPSVALDL